MKNTLNKCDDELNLSKIDGALAVFMLGHVFFSMVILKYIVFDLALLVKFQSYFNDKLFAIFLFYIPVSLFEIFPVFIILKYRKQSLRSIGFNKNKILKQISIGIMLYIPIYLLVLIFNWITGVKFKLDSMSIWHFLYLLIEVAFVEEVIFRGFIQVRLKALIKNKYVNLLVAAFAFGIFHIPFMLAKSNLTFVQIFILLIPKMILHIYFVGIYKAGNNSIISATIAHGVNDFIAQL